MALAIAGSGLAMLLVAVGLIVFATRDAEGTPTDASVTSAMQAAGCTVRNVAPVMTQQHVSSETAPVRWNTFPPAAGTHFANTAVWNFYREPVNPRNVVHNEEHGGVILWWGPETPASTIDELEAFYQESPEAMLGTPLAANNPGLTFTGEADPNLGSRVAITAWTIDDPSTYFDNGNFGVAHVAVCPTFNEEAFTKFRDAYRGHGPEGIPANFNRPGGN